MKKIISSRCVTAIGSCAMLSTSAMGQGLKNENILAPMPSGFVAGNVARNARGSIGEFVPEGETVNNWSKMITIQVFFGKGGLRPAEFAAQLAKGWMRACPGAEVAKIREEPEFGYPTGLWLYVCPVNPATKKPENMWLKAIEGRDSLYSVQYAVRTELSKEMAPLAMKFLHAVKVCDSRRPENVCAK